MSFRRQTSAFFDELTNIVNEQIKMKSEGENAESETPFSSMLTQDEEPVTEQAGVLEEPEPEVITRQGL